MNSINISARDLEAFLALVQTAHFTRAAERCHLSQSAFSQRIQRIEAMAQVQLFKRSTRQVALTPEGEVFAKEVERIGHDLQQALSQLKDLATLRTGRVAIAALPSVAAVWMPQVIERYRLAYPQVQLSLFDTLAEPGLALLREGKVDLAITAGGDWREFEVQVLRSERYFLVCRTDHPLAARRSVLLKELQALRWVHMARHSSVRRHLEEIAGKASVPATAPRSKHGELEVEHLATVAALVSQDLGISVVPELTLFHFIRAGLVAVPVRDAALRRPVVLAHRKDRALSMAAKAAIDMVCTVAAIRPTTSPR